MVTSKNDLRWRRTHEQIKLGFIKELSQQPFEQLTISSLIKTAGISRRAFYMHYADKYDLRAQLEAGLIQQLEAAFEKDHEHFLQDLKNQQALWQQYTVLLTNVLTLINQERQLFRVLLSANGDAHFIQRLRELVAGEIDTRVALYHAHFTDKLPRQYALVMIVDGLLGLIMAWLNNPHPESVEHFSQILTASQLIAPLNLLEED